MSCFGCVVIISINQGTERMVVEMADMLLTVLEFSRVSNPLADSIFEHYAHSGLLTAGLAHIYDCLMVSGVDPMHGVEWLLDVLAEAECAYGL